MSTQTEHLHLDLREAADIFNPLSTNANFESLDNIIYEIQTKGGVPTYTTTASANLLKLSQNPTPNVTVFKFVAAGDANTWSYQETVNDIVALDGSKKTVKGGEMYVAWVNAANAMVVIAWPDVVNAQTFDGKGPAEWATKAQLDAVNQTAANATQTAQAAATVGNQALDTANQALAGLETAGMKIVNVWTNPTPGTLSFGNHKYDDNVDIRNINAKFLIFSFSFTDTNGTQYQYSHVVIPNVVPQRIVIEKLWAFDGRYLYNSSITIGGTDFSSGGGYRKDTNTSTNVQDDKACAINKIIAVI